jgi:hypothetical protein
MTEKDDVKKAKDLKKIKKMFSDENFRKRFEREMGMGFYELDAIDVVYCHATDKFVSRDGCHFCSGLYRDYSDSNHEVRCNKDNDEAHPYHGEWTLEEMIKRLTDERDHIIKEKEQEMKDRAKYGRIKHETEDEIEERERFARELSRVSVEDMFRPFTI